VQFVGILLFGFWAVGMMLWGIALLRRGRFETSEGPGPPLRSAAIALSTGATLSAVGWILIACAQGATGVVLAGIVPLYVAIPFIAVGYAHLAVAWAARSAAPGLLRRSLTALGRMALSNYHSQSLLLGLVFYGHGLGLIGRLGFLETMAIAPLVWGLQLAISTWWLRHFAQGPMEWLWRSLAQGRRLPMRIPRP